MSDATNDFVCPSCYDRSCFPTSCIRCGNIDMLPQSATPTNGSVPTVERAHRLPSERSIWHAVITTVLVVGCVLGCIARVAVRVYPEHSSEILLGVFAFVIASKAIMFFDAYKRVDIGDLLRGVSSLYRDVRRTRIADTNDGLVRIAGVGQLLVQHLTPEGLASLAYRSNMLVDGAPSPIPFTTNVDAGCFVVSDGSGMNALVNSRWVEIEGRTARNGSINVPPGSTIEVRGSARRVPVPEAMNGGLRRAPEILEFFGTPEQPVVIRVIDPKDAAAAAAAANDSNTATSDRSLPAPTSPASTRIRIATETAVPSGLESTVERASIPSMHRSVRV